MKKIAIVTARSGSKGLKDKNIKPLNGKPLMAYTIEAALKSNVFDNVFVSTDSKIYADIAQKYGADVSFLRPDYLSGDEVSSNEVIRYVLKRFEEDGEKFDCFMLLQPTSPLRTGDDIRNAVKLMEEKNANAVVSLCEVDHSPLYTGQIADSLLIDGFIKDIPFRRQDLQTYYRLNGAIYLAKTDYFLEYNDWYKKDCYAYVMDKRRSLDIDDEIDFEYSEVLLKKFISKEYE